jgi:prepilin-type N-terminal cleavage/methylation domain-containing protein
MNPLSIKFYRTSSFPFLFSREGTKRSAAAQIESHARQSGFTLLEVLVATAILGIAIAVVLQLFSANLRAISDSGDYVIAIARAEMKMREVMATDDLAEKAYSELTNDGYRIDISVAETLKDRTENLQVRLLEIDMTIHWTKGTKERAYALRTMKLVKKQI